MIHIKIKTDADGYCLNTCRFGMKMGNGELIREGSYICDAFCAYSDNWHLHEFDCFHPDSEK